MTPEMIRALDRAMTLLKVAKGLNGEGTLSVLVDLSLALALHAAEGSGMTPEEVVAAVTAKLPKNRCLKRGQT